MKKFNSIESLDSFGVKCLDKSESLEITGGNAAETAGYIVGGVVGFVVFGVATGIILAGRKFFY